MDLFNMTDGLSLTQALLLLGGVVLLALALHGWWQTRRLQQRRTPLRTTATAADSRLEPGLGTADASAAPAAPGDDAPPGATDGNPGAEPAAGDGAEPDTDTEPDTGPDTVPAPLQPPLRAAPQLDALIDALVPMSLEAPITGELALLHLPPSRRAGNKPFYIEGLDVQTGQWERFAPGRRYSELQAGVQLVNRSGPLGEIEYSEFVQKVQAFADAVGASTDVPDMLEVAARARELDSLASPLDAQLSVTLVTRQVAWSVAFLQQSAARLGFVPGSVAGRMVVPAGEPGAPPLLVLGFDAHAALADDPQGTALRQCTLMLDVPQSAESAQPFPAWLEATRRLAQALDAEIVDNGGQPITPQAFDGIGAELQDLYRQLQALDLAAGTPAARRLFS